MQQAFFAALANTDAIHSTQNLDGVSPKCQFDEGWGVADFLDQNSRQRLQEGDARAEPSKYLCQFAADGTSATLAPSPVVLPP